MVITILGTDHRYEAHARTVEDHIRRYEPDQVFREGFRDLDPRDIDAAYSDYLEELDGALDVAKSIPDTYETVTDPDALCPRTKHDIYDGRAYDLHPAVLEENDVLDGVAERKRSPSSTESYRAVAAADDTGSVLYGCDMDLPRLLGNKDAETIIQRLTDPQFNRRREDVMVERISTLYDGGEALAVLGSTHVDNVAADLERVGHAVETETLQEDWRVDIDEAAYTDYVIKEIQDGGRNGRPG